MNRVSARSVKQLGRFGARPEIQAGTRALPQDRLDLARLIQFLRRRARWIGGTTALALALGLVFYLVAPAKYRSAAELLIDPRGIAVSKSDSASQTQGADSNLLDLETYRYLILSKAVLGSVVDSEHLADDPRFAGPGFFGRLFKFGAKSGDAREAALAKLIDSVEVVRGERALILDVVVTTSDPQLSARLANAISRAFFTQQANARTEAAKRAGLALQTRAEQLARQVQEAEVKVERYKSEHDLSGQAGKLTEEQQLNDVNYQLGLARSQTATQHARYEEALRLSRSRAETDQLSEAESSQVLIGLRAQYAALMQQKSALETQFGAQYPAVVDVNRQLRTVSGLIKDELTRLVGAALSDYRRAQAKEAALEKTLTELKQKSYRQNESVIGLRALERGLEATRALYQSSLTRAKDLEETQDVDSSTSRIITEATPASKRSGAPLPLILGGALICGLGLGSALGYLRDLSSNNVDAGAGASLGDRLGLPVVAQAVFARRDAIGNAAASRRGDPPAIEVQSEQLLDWILSIPPRYGARIICVAGLDGDLRKSRILFELGVACLLDKRRALVVDTDLDGGAASSFWRKAGEGLVSAERRVQPFELAAFELAPFEEFEASFAIYGPGPGALEFLWLGDVTGRNRNSLTAGRLERALQPWTEDADIVLIDAGIDENLDRACREISDGLVVLVDSDHMRASDMASLSDRLGPKYPDSTCVMLVSERAAA
ncbi:GumC family protein [Methylocystis iwaonis]|uniref:GumC family protein n=1 Tax=Methylocystis iwaonis TaxID=2885079 RepID=UPI002E7B0713|nr:Wzz/FepE/Etk N-terminal domain-containing protein [Methylocystis iwaonis]